MNSSLRNFSMFSHLCKSKNETNNTFDQSAKNTKYITIEEDQHGVFIEPDESQKKNPFSQVFCEILEEKLPEIKRIPEKLSEIKTLKSNGNEKEETSSKRYLYNQQKILKNSINSLDVYFDGFEEITDSIRNCHLAKSSMSIENLKPTVDEEIISDISNFSFPKVSENLPHNNNLNQGFIKEYAINTSKFIDEKDIGCIKTEDDPKGFCEREEEFKVSLERRIQESKKKVVERILEKVGKKAANEKNEMKEQGKVSTKKSDEKNIFENATKTITIEDPEEVIEHEMKSAQNFINVNALNSESGSFLEKNLKLSNSNLQVSSGGRKEYSYLKEKTNLGKKKPHNSLISEIEQRMSENASEIKEIKENKKNNMRETFIPFSVKNQEIIDLSEKTESDFQDKKNEIFEAIEGFNEDIFEGKKCQELSLSINEVQTEKLTTQIHCSKPFERKAYENGKTLTENKSPYNKEETDCDDLIILRKEQFHRISPQKIIVPTQDLEKKPTPSKATAVSVNIPNKITVASQAPEKKPTPSKIPLSISSPTIIFAPTQTLDDNEKKENSDFILISTPEENSGIQEISTLKQEAFSLASINEEGKISIFSTIKEIRDQQKKLNYKRKLAEIREETNFIDAKGSNIPSTEQEEPTIIEKEPACQKKKSPVPPWSYCVYCNSNIEEIKAVNIMRLCLKCLGNINLLRNNYEISLLDEPDRFEYIEKKQKIGPRFQGKIPQIQDKNENKEDKKNLRKDASFMKMNSAQTQMDEKIFQEVLDEVRKIFGVKVSIEKICYILTFFNYNAEECIKHIRADKEVWFNFLNNLKF